MARNVRGKFRFTIRGLRRKFRSSSHMFGFGVISFLKAGISGCRGVPSWTPSALRISAPGVLTWNSRKGAHGGTPLHFTANYKRASL